MITLYSGTPGSGKSLHTAEIIYNRLKYGHATICNFPVKVNYRQVKAKRYYDCFCCVDNVDLTVPFLVEYSKRYFKNRKIKEGEILLIIDEAGILFNSRDYSRKDRAEWCKFFSQHRKLGFDVILIAQFDRMLDRQVRAQIEYEVVHRKVSNFGSIGKLLSVFSFGKLFVAVRLWYPMGREKVGSSFFRAHKKYYDLYDTFATFDVSTLSGDFVREDRVTLTDYIARRVESGCSAGPRRNPTREDSALQEVAL